MLANSYMSWERKEKERVTACCFSLVTKSSASVFRGGRNVVRLRQLVFPPSGAHGLQAVAFTNLSLGSAFM